MKRKLVAGILLFSLTSGIAMPTLWVDIYYHDNFIEASIGWSGGGGHNVDEEDLAAFSDRGDSVYVYWGNAGLKNVDIKEKLLDTYYNNKGIDEPEAWSLPDKKLPISGPQKLAIESPLSEMSLEKERLSQELGATRVQILEEVLKLLASKSKADQEKIYQIVKTFTESEDRYTQNIGKYMMLSVAPN